MTSARAGDGLDSPRTARSAGQERGPRLLKDVARRSATAVQFALGHFTRRDPRVWVFGNHKGFRDNPRYLAEHVLRADPTVTAWWIARSNDEAAQARATGLRVAMRGSPAAAAAQRRAGVAFLTNGFEDLESRHLGGAFVVDLRHGKGLKKILLDMGPASAGRSPLSRLASGINRWFVARRLSQIDMIVAPGEMARARYLTAFRGPPERIRVLGTPRFDVILGGPSYDRVVGGDLRQRLGLRADDYVVLWLPTWREDGDAAWLPPLRAEDLARALDGTQAVIVVKPHPFSDAQVFAERLPRHPRFRLLGDADVDANALLRVGDALITDYSSVAFDYALLDRPMHFLLPDLDRYRGGEGLYEPMEQLTGGLHHLGWATLLERLRRSALGDDAPERALAARIRAHGGNDDRPGSCERIRLAVAEAVGILPSSAPS